MEKFLSDAYAYALAHGPAVATFLLLLIPTLITGLTPYPKVAGVVSGLRIVLNLLSLLTHHDSPGTFKLPLTISPKPDDSGSVTRLRGCARLEVLVALAIGCSLLSFAARAEDPPRAVPVLPQVAESDPVPTPPPAEPQFGGCVKAGKLCFGPSVAMTVAAINLETKAIEGAFSPGVGYGFTLNPGKWSSLGGDAFFTLDPAAQKASASVLLKFFNGYARVGVSKGIIGDVAWRIPIAVGIPTPF